MELPKNNDITYFAETNFRNQKIKFGIRPDDRRRHLYSVGKTGMGKTAMLENMAIQDIQKGHGLAVVDPHGEFAEKMLDFVPSSRVNDVIYFNPADIAYPIAFNVIEKVQPDFRYLIASGVLGVFKKIWPDVWSPRMEYILNNTILALIEYPGATLLGINRMLAEKEYRDKVVKRITDPGVKAFWLNEFSKYPDRFREEAVAPIQNKAGQFISSPLIRNIIGQTKSTINVRKVIDEGKILILNLSKGRIGEDASHLLGALMVSKIQLAAMSRVNIPEEERKDFYLYVDEFQNFATESFVNILSEARKYRLSLVLGNQYISQLEEMTPTGRSTRVRDAIFGNVGTMIIFRVGAEDAEFLENEFLPELTANDLVNLAKYNVYLKLMIDGISGRPFSAETLPPMAKPEKSNREKIIKVSRERYGTSRQVVEEKIRRWMGALEFPVNSQPVSPVLYDARCSLCGKDTKVVFPPDGVRPVYCKPCRKKIEKEKEQRESGIVSLKEATKREPVSFSPSKKITSWREKTEKEKKRKTVNLEELKKTLEESLKKSKEQ